MKDRPVAVPVGPVLRLTAKFWKALYASVEPLPTSIMSALALVDLMIDETADVPLPGPPPAEEPMIPTLDVVIVRVELVT
jgi:hypothetical protein